MLHMSIYIYTYIYIYRISDNLCAHHNAIHQYLVRLIEAVALAEVDAAEHSGLGRHCSLCIRDVGQHLVDDFRR